MADSTIGEMLAREIGYGEGVKEERLACAELVRTAGCGCGGGHGPDRDDDDVYLNEEDGWHASWCPISIAAIIEARGRG